MPYIFVGTPLLNSDLNPIINHSPVWRAKTDKTAKRNDPFILNIPGNKTLDYLYNIPSHALFDNASNTESTVEQ